MFDFIVAVGTSNHFDDKFRISPINSIFAILLNSNPKLAPFTRIHFHGGRQSHPSKTKAMAGHCHDILGTYAAYNYWTLAVASTIHAELEFETAAYWRLLLVCSQH